MADYKVASVVEQMVRYLPFDADAQNLIEEHVSAEDAPDPYETKAFGFVMGLLADPDTSLIVLTGDAGHGKTHICRRILERSGLKPREATEQLGNDPEGQAIVELPESDRPVRVVKDLSEFTEERGAALLKEAAEDTATVAIVSANEGRLRSVASLAPSALGPLLDALEQGLREGATTVDGSSHVINLNFQSVVPPEGGFLLHLLDSWARDGRRWVSCSTCKAKDSCPIYHNKEYLGERTADGDRRRDALVHLIRTAEQTDYVLTIRETLIFVAYLLTGNLTCRDVHDLHRRNAVKQLREYAFDRLLFERTLTPREEKQLGVLRRIRRYDPGLNPHRDVDDHAVRTLEDEGELGGAAWFGGSPPAQTRRQRKDEADRLRQLVRTSRRNSFFKAPRPGVAGTLDRARRTGLYHYGGFNHIQGPNEDPAKMRGAIERVIGGLHVVQGIRPADRSHLYLVDPAFSRSGSHTSVIAVSIPKRHLWLWGLHEYWHQERMAAPPLMQAVDWLDRSVVLCRGQENPEHLLELNLLQFEYVLRAEEGVSFPQFHAADRRRLLATLASVAEREKAADGEIRFVIGDKVKRIGIERDGTIEVHGAS